jgi:hypothetical protein
LNPSLSFAAPVVTGASGTVASGGVITISGSGFGSHTMQVESLQTNIESGTTGQSLTKTGWIKDWGWANPLYATDSKHSGSKSLKCSMNSDNYNCAFAYDMPNVAPGQRFYATWWVKYSGDTNGQWKMFRASGNETIIDGSQEVALFNWLNSSRQLVIDPGTSNDQTKWLASSAYPEGNNTWYRVELDFIAGSAGSANGTLSVRTTSDSGASNSETFSNMKTHASSGNTWSYAIWQNYAGNGITNATVWFDDLYVQYNTPARVELCSGSTWANRGKCEIQVPSSWGASSISAAVNPGSFSSGSAAYVYVVDSTGNANSSGYNVSIGSSSTTITPPAPTLNLIRTQ